jgi:hypothetical protein
MGKLFDIVCLVHSLDKKYCIQLVSFNLGDLKCLDALSRCPGELLNCDWLTGSLALGQHWANQCILLTCTTLFSRIRSRSSGGRQLFSSTSSGGGAAGSGAERATDHARSAVSTAVTLSFQTTAQWSGVEWGGKGGAGALTCGRAWRARQAWRAWQVGCVDHCRCTIKYKIL